MNIYDKDKQQWIVDCNDKYAPTKEEPLHISVLNGLAGIATVALVMTLLIAVIE